MKSNLGFNRVNYVYTVLCRAQNQFSRAEPGPLNRKANQASGITDIQLAHQICAMRVHSSVADEELGRYLFGRQAF